MSLPEMKPYTTGLLPVPQVPVPQARDRGPIEFLSAAPAQPPAVVGSGNGLDAYLERVEVVLDDFFAASAYRAHRLVPRFGQLWHALQSTTRGGKRFRPRLVWSASEGLGGADLETAALVGAAFELLHTALIVHDDVVDRDFVRRGRPNVSGQYLAKALAQGFSRSEAEHRAMSVGVVAGDLALFNAYRLIDRTPVPGHTRLRLMAILDDAVFCSAAGEFLDIEYSSRNGGVPVEDVVDMERLKTAVYSFEGPLKAGAVLAGAGEETIAGLGEIGCSMGVAYQIVDDLLGVFGDEPGTGKSNLGDVREGKRTVLISHASGQPQWAAIEEHLGNPELSREQADEVRGLLTSSGSRAYAEHLVVHFAEQARARLAAPDIPESLRSALEQFIPSLLARSR